ncbi:GGDEF domain-containing protein [Amorphus sp. 3PC139-8]|uniref:GGDEF domain-containing protein n=1 Tax=Amorphus sp. 3PC139-8 TaxID=2735676 RepID=UPI00345DD5B7
MFDLSIALLRNAGLIAVVAVAYSVVPQRLKDNAIEAVILGVLFGLGAVLAMVDPVHLRPGLIVDSRTTLVILAGLFGGPVAAAISAALAIAYRLYLGGVGAYPGSLVIVLSALISLFGYYVLRRNGEKAVDFKILTIIALLSPFTTFAAFLLPWTIALRVLEDTFIPSSIVRVAGVLLLGTILIHERARRQAEQRIAELAGTDELCGLANRRAFYSALQRQIERSRRFNEPYCVIILDIDRFKSINDTHGHPTGDEVIRRLAEVLRRTCRETDVPARIGGEEFAVLLTNTSAGDGVNLAERIRSAVASEKIETRDETLSFTVSLGISSNHGMGMSLETVMTAADNALYISKNSGRNRVSAVDWETANALATAGLRY